MSRHRPWRLQSSQKFDPLPPFQDCQKYGRSGPKTKATISNAQKLRWAKYRLANGAARTGDTELLPTTSGCIRYRPVEPRPNS